MENKLNYLNKYFSEISNFKLEKKFEEEQDYYKGELSITTKKDTLRFVIFIPLIYPFGEAQFFTKSIKGYPHQIYLNDDLGGAICLNTPFINDFVIKLKLDVDKLSNWIIKYYEEDEEDEHYEYPIHKINGDYELIFEESSEDFSESRFSETKFGSFNFFLLNQSTEDSKCPALLAHNLGNKPSKWSDFYSSFDKKSLGFWVYIENEPIVQKREKLSDFKDLIELFPEKFSSFLFKNAIKEDFKLQFSNINDSKPFSLLAAGYKIPSLNKGFEIHWDLIILQTRYYAKTKINWCSSKNASYERFFGRGRLCDEIVNSKILVLGVGAIGSSLCEILVRGGAKHISISDSDLVDIGNICRSVYTFNDNRCPKVMRLALKLLWTSPYVNLQARNGIYVTAKPSKKFDKINEMINEFDFIFDCTANNEMLQFLEMLDIKNRVLHISITDKSKQMICISNNNSIIMTERRNSILSLLKENSEPTFREGTGCYYPTFQASFFDINALLNLSIRKINDMARKKNFKNFITFYKGDSIVIDKDVIFRQKQLNLGLVITSECLNHIKEVSLANYPYEFGGYLLGYYSEDGKLVFIVDIIIPTKFNNSPTSFQPDKNSMNESLAKVHNNFEGKIRYLGEWHTHPNMSKQYSSTDYYSMHKIATSKDVNINNPLMLIVSLGRQYFNPAFYVYFDTQLYEFDKEECNLDF